MEIMVKHKDHHCLRGPVLFFFCVIWCRFVKGPVLTRSKPWLAERCAGGAVIEPCSSQIRTFSSHFTM